MLPVTHGVPYTRLQVLLYTVLLVLVTLLPWVTRMSRSHLSCCCARAATRRFLYYALALKLTDRSELPMDVFRYSISYLMWIFAALLLDHYLPTTRCSCPADQRAKPNRRSATNRILASLGAKCRGRSVTWQEGHIVAKRKEIGADRCTQLRDIAARQIVAAHEPGEDDVADDRERAPPRGRTPRGQAYARDNGGLRTRPRPPSPGRPAPASGSA
jgi:hypothetical protein